MVAPMHYYGYVYYKEALMGSMHQRLLAFALSIALVVLCIPNGRAFAQEGEAVPLGQKASIEEVELTQAQVPASNDAGVPFVAEESEGIAGAQDATSALVAAKAAPHVSYRAHVQTYGWQGWSQDGATAGTSGQSKRLEAIQIVLTPNGAPSPSNDFGGASTANSAAFIAGNGAPSAGTPTSPGARAGGALHVFGNKLVDQNGRAIQLRGVSTHGLAWFPGYVNDACFGQLRNNWNANVVRLAMYTEEYGGYCSGGNQGELRDLVKTGVRLAASNDLYAIVDWHILSDGNPNRHVSEAKDFFNDTSSTLRDYTNVLYEICNEPNGGTTWDDIKQYANQVIPVIR